MLRRIHIQCDPENLRDRCQSRVAVNVYEPSRDAATGSWITRCPVCDKILSDTKGMYLVGYTYVETEMCVPRILGAPSEGCCGKERLLPALFATLEDAEVAKNQVISGFFHDSHAPKGPYWIVTPFRSPESNGDAYFYLEIPQK
jgi:hypothetical protein